MSTIRVIQRLIIWNAQKVDGFEAQIDGEPGKWEAGRTEDEAISKLIISFPELKDAVVLHVPQPRLFT
jgi:hypothetical protein